ncbi:MAG TPA: beta-galactosidase [Solirubrobacteraceae bacterium]
MGRRLRHMVIGSLCVWCGGMTIVRPVLARPIATTPASVQPTTPTQVAAIAGSSSATVRWTAPATVDGAPVISFTVTASTGQTMTADVPNDWAIVPGLADGTPVSFTVTATSSAGTSAPSPASASVTPAPVAAPRHVLLGTPQKVGYDRYSVTIGGHHVLLWAGEFDAYRLPSPSLWIDRLEEMKAAGFNAVSVYFNWDETSPAPGVYNFGGVRNVNRLLNDAQRVGLYVIARPGPYINAESDAGGLAGWLASEPAGSRMDDPQYLAAADQWLSEIDPIIAAHQITRGGDVILYQIENEYGYTDPDGEAYFANLEAQARQDGIDVPTDTNNVGGYANGWAPGTPSAPDINGSDQYPEGFDCADTSKFTAPPVLTSDHNPGHPLTVPEYQGGSFDSWGGTGYADCAALTGPDFEDTFYRYYIAQGVSLQSIYMAIGGTDWGFIPAPFMYTSYDYGSAISEPGTLSDKFPQLKLAGELSQALPALAMTNQVTPPTVGGLTTFEERNPDNGTTFLYLGNDGTSPVSTPLPGEPSMSVTIPGHAAKLLASHATLGGAKLLATTSEIIARQSSGGRAVALLDGDPGAAGATALQFAQRPTVSVAGDGPVSVHWNSATHRLMLRYTTSGLREVTITAGSRTLELLIADTTTAAQFWVEHTATGPLLVRGAELVRTAAVQGHRAVLTGDTAVAGPLTVWGPPSLAHITWDGQPLASSPAAGGGVSAQLPGPPSSIGLPALTGWRFRFGSAERLPEYDDSSWPKADRTVTDNPIQPPSGQPDLYAQDYGFDNGFVWYRGRFTATGSEQSISLTADTGPFGSFAVWLDGHYLGSATTPTPVESMADSPVSGTFAVPADLLHAGQAAEISVLAENMGEDESFENALGLDSDKTPRGLESATVAVSSGTAPTVRWRVHGASAAQARRDPVRGILNAAGLGESNAGWGLPGYPDASWTPVTLPDSWAARSVPPGVGWYRTTFSLHVPHGVWAPIGLTLTPPAGPAAAAGGQNFQALIYLNGWLIGRYINNLGPQKTFYLPAGLLRQNGTNTLAIAEWSLAGGAGGLGSVTLSPYEVLRGGIKVQRVPSPGYRKVR